MRHTVLATAVLLQALVASAEEPYRIGPGDVLRVVVLGQAEMTGEFPVDSEGMLTFPVLGKIEAAGSSAPELEAVLTRRLADGYLKRPQVSVAVHEFRSQQVFVTGEVQKPGPYPLRADRTLRALLSDVGSLTVNGGHEVLIIRPARPSGASPVAPDEGAAESAAEVFRVSLLDLQSGHAQANVVLQPGDTVHLPRAAQVYVSGHVARPGSYRFQEGSTVLQALTLAGGLTERGSSKRIKVLRNVNGRKAEVKVKLTDPVLPEDTILVPERFF